MPALHVALAVLVAVAWGGAFLATRLALDVFSPSQLTALRFLIAAVPALVIPRPRVAGNVLVGIGLTLFAGQFLFQFFAIASGVPPGLAATVVQMQAVFTIALAAVALGQRPTARQSGGIVLGLAGLLVIATTVGEDLSVFGLTLALLSALSWSAGNVLLARVRGVDILHVVVWASLVPPLPALFLSMAVDGPGAMRVALTRASVVAVAAAIYLGAIATVAAYATWGALLRRHPVAVVAPFGLLTPFVAACGSSLAFGERFGPARLAGMGLVLLGLAVIVAPSRRSSPETVARSSA